MLFYVLFVIIFIQFRTVLCDKSTYDYYNDNLLYGPYRGEMFPSKYLYIEDTQPTAKDLSYYVKTLERVVDYFALALNDSDANVAIGTYFMSGILRRTIKDYGDKIANEDKIILLDVIRKSDDLLSHFVYNSYKYGPGDIGFGLSRLFKDYDSMVYSIGNFTRNKIQKWIHSNVMPNNYTEEMDNMTLPREIYAQLVVGMNDYYDVADSDLCISRISSHAMPLRKDYELKSCRMDDFCKKRSFKMPTVAYALSHQYLYIMALSLTRRCYVISEEVDRTHMEILCANMYREVVYLARRGFFYRDIFMEHIALCAMLGFEEFYRRNWFLKSASWVDEDGCMVENKNFEMNRTRLYAAEVKNKQQLKRLKNLRAMQMADECHHHQMALIVCVLAHGIRHAAHFMKTTY